MISRFELIEQAILDCLDEMYKASQPSISFKELCENSKSNPDDTWYLKHYLSKEQYQDILESYISAYRIKNEFHDDMECVKAYLRDGGTKDKYIRPKDGSPGYRGYEDTPKLSELIGEEHAKIALDLIEECNKFYQPHTEENKFRFNISNYGPCCSIDTVRKQYEGTDVKIYETKLDEDTEEYILIKDDH